MWDCVKCLCRAIAGSLTHCPVCKEERQMPKVNAAGDATSRDAAEGEPGYVAPAEPEQHAEDAQEHSEATPAEPQPEPAQAASEPQVVHAAGFPEEPAPVSMTGSVRLPSLGAGTTPPPPPSGEAQ